MTQEGKLTPVSLVYVKIFCAQDSEQLMADINAWVDSAASVISGVGAVSELSDGRLLLSVAYVPAVVGEDDDADAWM